MLTLLLGACPCLGEDAPFRPLRARVVNVFRDPVDNHTLFLTLDCDGQTRYGFYYCWTNDPNAVYVHLEQYVGREIETVGRPVQVDSTALRHHIRTLTEIDPALRIKALSSPANDPFDSPELANDPPALETIDTCGPRKVCGVVLARWHGDSLLVRTPTGEAIQVNVLNLPLPEVGACIEAVGKVASNLYRYSLLQSRWRPHASCSVPETPPRPTTLDRLFTENGHGAINTRAHGQVLTIRGRLKSFLTSEDGVRRLLVDDGTWRIVVDCSGLATFPSDLKEGAELQVTGVCVMESENWHSDLIFPRVSQLFLVLRTGEDIRILRNPPWLTPGRSALILLSLLGLLAAILVWNAALRTLVANKSRALLKEQALRLAEQLKLDERTRLAAELHDFHCQNLTAIAYQISAARDACANVDNDIRTSLDVAAVMLKSCRTELRRCLWDLRNDALDLNDFNEAIRRSVTPVAGEAAVTVRFVGRRASISDFTAHAIISILRELTANAARHGHAKNIRIAGEQHERVVRLSVSDDGCGFDPAHHAGPDEGHFGLNGIGERLRRIGGTMDITSAPQSGTYVRLIIQHVHLPTP